MGKDLGEDGKKKPSEVVWHEEAPEGKLDLLVTLDFRMSTTCMYSDIVLPTATWYEKNDLNTSDMHPFIHPLTSAVDPVWEARNDWDIYKGIAKAFSAVAPEVLGVEKDVVLTPILHDTAGRNRAGLRRQGLEEGRNRSDSRQDHAGGHGGRARLSQSLQAFHLARTADGQARQWRQGHELEYRTRSRLPQAAQRRRHRGGRQQRPGADRKRHRCLRSHPQSCAGNQRRGCRQGMGLAWWLHRARAHASRHSEGGREDPLPRCGRATAQDHFLAHLVRA